MSHQEENKELNQNFENDEMHQNFESRELNQNFEKSLVVDKEVITSQTLPSEYIEPYSREVLVAVLTYPTHVNASNVKLPLPPRQLEKTTALLGLRVPTVDDEFRYLPNYELKFQKFVNHVAGEIDFSTHWNDKKEVEQVFKDHINRYLPEKRVNWGDITTDENTARFIFQGPGFSRVEPFTEIDDLHFFTLYPDEYCSLNVKPVYKVCYAFMKNFSVMDGLERHGTNAYFSNENSYPQLLFIENDNKIYKPFNSLSSNNSESYNQWEYQKFVLRSAAMIYGTVVDHAGICHFTVANSCNMAAKEILPNDHILRRLLQIFTCGSAQINLVASYLLIPAQDGGFSRKGLGNEGLKSILKHGLDNYIWKSFPKQIEDQGLNNSNLPIVQDGIRIWNIIEDFIDKFVNSYIKCKDDTILDTDVLKFWERVREYIPLTNNIPLTLNKSLFKEYLCKVIFSDIAYHTHIGEAVEYFNPYYYSWAIKKNIPSAPKMTLGIDFWVVLGTGVKSPMILDNWFHMFSDQDMFAYCQALFGDFQEKLHELSQEIETENLIRKWVFRNFNPKYSLSSVSI